MDHPLIFSSMHKMNIPQREGCVGSLISTKNKTNSYYISEFNPNFTSWFYRFEVSLKLT